MNWKQTVVLMGLLAALALWFALDLGQWLQLDRVQSQIEALQDYRHQQPLLAGLGYFLVYVAVTGLSVPGAAVLTLAGGALFGFWYALLLVSFASSVGATLACAVSRVLLRGWVQGRFGRQLQSLNRGFERDGAFYLFGLRLVPLFPFFVVNLAAGVLPIPLWRFYWVSQLGMLAGTAVYVNAGTQLAQLRGLDGILSPQLLASFALLAVFPILARWLLETLRRRMVLRPFSKPRYFDDNLIVIGAGSAGLVAALIAATVRAKVSLVERDRMGGDCLNTGCVPSKTLIRSARIADYLRRAPEFGMAPVEVSVRFPEVMERVQSAIRQIEPHDSVERFTGLGVNCIAGSAKVISPWQVDIDGQVRSARNIIVASGARPFVPPVPGLDRIDYLTSDSLWDIRELPGHLLVMGAGPIGCELAQAFSRLGSRVTLVDMAPQMLPREDSDVSALVHDSFATQGIDVRVNCQVTGFSGSGPGGEVELQWGGDSRTLAFDRVLVAVGRKPNIEGMGLEELGLAIGPGGTLEVDDFLRTSMPTIFACGDVAGPYQFTHTAGHQAWYAAVNALFGQFRRFRVDYSVIPWATFTDPEVARVGLNEQEAEEQGVAHEVTRYDMGDLDRAIVDGEARGLVKVLTAPGRDRILGATVVGHHAAELLVEYVMAMKHGIGLNKILGTIHAYPTLVESAKFVAGEWRKAHKPEGLLKLAERLHARNRGRPPAHERG